MKRFKRFLPTSFRRGSVLAYTLILLSVVLLAAIGIATVSVTNERGSLLSSRSVSSFQVADTGSQAAIVAIREELSSGGSKLNDLTIAGGGCSNSGGVATIVSASSGTPGKYTLTFYDKDENQLGCSDDLSQIATVKSVGEYRDTSRAVKVAVAAGSCPATGGLVLADSSSDQNGFSLSNLMNYVNGGNARIAEGRCSWGGQTSAFSSSYTFATSSVLMGSAGGSTTMTCSGSSCMVSGGVLCSGGWRIYVECPVL